MYFIKLKDIFVTHGIKNQNNIKRSLVHQYGLLIDHKIYLLKEQQDENVKNVYVDISKGDPWFGSNGMLDVELTITLTNDEEWMIRFPLQWNHTSFCSNTKIITNAEWF